MLNGCCRRRWRCSVHSIVLEPVVGADWLSSPDAPTDTITHMQERINSNAASSPVPQYIMEYNDNKGILALRTLYCALLERTTMAGSQVWSHP